MVIIIIMFTIFMAAVTFIAAIKGDGIQEKYFKLIKIKKMSFLFIGIYMQSTRKHGVIKPFLIMQIIGYFYTLTSAVLAIILPLAFNIELPKVALVLGIMLGALVVFLIGIHAGTQIVSKKRERDNYAYMDEEESH